MAFLCSEIRSAAATTAMHTACCIIYIDIHTHRYITYTHTDIQDTHVFSPSDKIPCPHAMHTASRILYIYIHYVHQHTMYLDTWCARTPEMIFDFCAISLQQDPYGVATVSRIDKILGLFCRILALL